MRSGGDNSLRRLTLLRRYFEQSGDEERSPAGRSLTGAVGDKPPVSRSASNSSTPNPGTSAMETTFRIVTRGTNGEIRTRDYHQPEPILKKHTQIGVDDCSTDLNLRGLPVFRGLIGPMPEGKHVVRYESPEVFETLTKEWSVAKPARRSRTKSLATSSAASAETVDSLAD